jgi:hypothetical protein
VFLAWVLFVPAADWLARHGVGNTTGAVLETARNNARGNLLGLTAGIAGFGALLFAARNFALQRRTLALTEQGQVTDRYTKAIEQLGSEKLDIRIGGIYALERVARDSARDHPVVMEVLATFIREHSRAREIPAGDEATSVQHIQADIQAALTVIGRREPQDTGRINLARSNLAGANLTRARLPDADLHGANLTGAYLGGANLSGADLHDVYLRGANLTDSNLGGAQMDGADLNEANLNEADLRLADLHVADLSDANLRGANLTRVTLLGGTAPAH